MDTRYGVRPGIVATLAFSESSIQLETAALLAPSIEERVSASRLVDACSEYFVRRADAIDRLVWLLDPVSDPAETLGEAVDLAMGYYPPARDLIEAHVVAAFPAGIDIDTGEDWRDTRI